MQFKQMTQVLLLAGILTLSACSSMHRHGNGMGGDGSSDSADATGLGAGEGMQGGAYSQSLADRRTYYFDFDKSEVRDSDKPAILANADYLIAHPSTKIILEGHTDPRGSREYNVALGERRGNAVQDILKSRGVNPDQIRVVSYGSERPAVEGHNEYAFQKDRRATIVIEQG